MIIVTERSWQQTSTSFDVGTTPRRASVEHALPNDLAICFALELGKGSGTSSVMTGDGSDELFAGYSCMGELMRELPPEDLGR